MYAKYVNRLIALLALTVMLQSSALRGDELGPGEVVFTGGTSFAENNDLGGTVLNDNLIDFEFPTPALFFLGGEVQNRVIQSDNLATMIFSPRIRDTINIVPGISEFNITAFTLDGYEGWDTDVEYRTDGLGDLGFTSVSRSADGNLLTFRFDSPLRISNLNPPGLQEESLFTSILTDAPGFSLTGNMTIFGHNSTTPDTLLQARLTGIAVPSSVPEPSSGGLLTILLACAGMAFRRRQAVNNPYL